MRGLEITPYAQGGERQDAGECARKKAVAKEEKHYDRTADGKNPIEQ